MKAKEIRKATKNLTFKQAEKFITNIGFELELQYDYGFSKRWSVKNNNEIHAISLNYIAEINTDYENFKSDVLFCFN